MVDPHQLMRAAIEVAQRGIAAKQSPFGCAIARGDQLVTANHNTVVADLDITAHAEINALRAACRMLGQIHLSDCIVATTCEPCPMCMAALHWARVKRVYFGASIADAAGAGFNEMPVSAADLLSQGGSQVVLTPGLLQEACVELFAQWQQQPERTPY